MILDQLKDILEKESFECAVTPPTQKVPFQRLLVVLDLDHKKRERIVEIIANEQKVSSEFALPPLTSLPYRFQFRIDLPFKIQNFALSQVSSLLLFLNQLLDLPGFELNELEGRVSYRYVWIAQAASLDKFSIMSIMGTIILNLALFADTIESLADGQKTFNDLLAQIIQNVEASRSSNS